MKTPFFENNSYIKMNENIRKKNIPLPEKVIKREIKDKNTVKLKFLVFKNNMAENPKIYNEYVAGSLNKPDGLNRPVMTPNASFLECSPVIEYK